MEVVWNCYWAEKRSKEVKCITEVVKVYAIVTLDPTKYLRWEWRFVPRPGKLGFFF